MKKHSNFRFSPVRATELKDLSSLVKETIARGLVPVPQRIFSTADLWSIQSQGRTAIQRRSAL
jgi:hypothetical protein